MRKSVLLIVLSFLLTIVLVGCGQKEIDPNKEVFRVGKYDEFYQMDPKITTSDGNYVSVLFHNISKQDNYETSEETFNNVIIVTLSAKKEILENYLNEVQSIELLDEKNNISTFSKGKIQKNGEYFDLILSLEEPIDKYKTILFGGFSDKDSKTIKVKFNLK